MRQWQEARYEEPYLKFVGFCAARGGSRAKFNAT